LTDANANYVSTAIAEISLTKINDSVGGEDEVTVSPVTADAGNTFRYDEESSQYTYNLATGNLSAGTWRFTVLLDDGKAHSVIISIR